MTGARVAGARPIAPPTLAEICQHPRHWPGCLLLALLRVTAWLPLTWTRVLGAGVGALMRAVNGKRRGIAAINIGLCFPELSVAEQERLVRRHFRLLGQSYFDAGFLAWASAARFGRYVHLRGEEHLRAAVEQKRAIILLAPHSVGLNVGGIACAARAPVYSMIKAQPDPVTNWLLHKTRSRYSSPLIERGAGLRPVLRALTPGHAFYYLPDEDFGPRHSEFTPFFGIQTATLTTLGRLARLADAVVIPCFTRLVPEGYEVTLHAPLADFPSHDRGADAAAMNRALEAGIRAAPEQYMWTFKLFKTRPGGTPSPYV